MSENTPKNHTHSMSAIPAGEGLLELPRDEAREIIAKLTPQQHAVIHAVACGLSYRRISVGFGIAYSTVRAHKRRAMRKIGVDTLTDAIVIFMRAQDK